MWRLDAVISVLGCRLESTRFRRMLATGRGLDEIVCFSALGIVAKPADSFQAWDRLVEGAGAPACTRLRGRPWVGKLTVELSELLQNR